MTQGLGYLKRKFKVLTSSLRCFTLPGRGPTIPLMVRWVHESEEVALTTEPCLSELPLFDRKMWTQVTYANTNRFSPTNIRNLLYCFTLAICLTHAIRTLFSGRCSHLSHKSYMVYVSLYTWWKLYITYTLHTSWKCSLTYLSTLSIIY